jgi:predicted alpha/beta-fold hydrolase
LVPVAFVVLVIELARTLSEMLSGDHDGEPVRRRFRRAPGMVTEPAERSVDDVVSHLKSFPWDPLRISPHAAFYREFAAEGIGMLLAQQPALSTIPHLYPRQFVNCLVEGADGVQLAALRAMHDEPGPALIICHGLLTTKNFDYVRQLALRAHTQWGFHVLAVDLRGWGQSAWTTDAPPSAGWGEGRDVVEVARRWLQDELVTSVGAVGYSLGGCTVLNASYQSSISDDSPLSGGVMSLCAPTDVQRAIDFISDRPATSDPFFPLWLTFRASLRTGLRARGLDHRISSWREVNEVVAVPWYGVSSDEFYSRASATTFADKITTPTLAIHAADDFVVPVHHAHALKEAAGDNPNLDVWIMDAGAHCSFTVVDPRWFRSVVRRWFEYWAVEGR